MRKQAVYTAFNKTDSQKNQTQWPTTAADNMIPIRLRKRNTLDASKQLSTSTSPRRSREIGETERTMRTRSYEDGTHASKSWQMQISTKTSTSPAKYPSITRCRLWSRRVYRAGKQKIENIFETQKLRLSPGKRRPEIGIFRADPASD
jgi:hypothetical protein